MEEKMAENLLEFGKFVIFGVAITIITFVISTRILQL